MLAFPVSTPRFPVVVVTYELTQVVVISCHPELVGIDLETGGRTRFPGPW
jgi:hypothetical protein